MRYIHLKGVKQNNLKNIDVDIPLGSFTVICGPSGSGKSSLAFETLYAEGQRRYIESLSNYAKQFIGKSPKPDIDSIQNIPPAVAIEQKNTIRNSRSTVGTTTEVIDYLRLIFEKISLVSCSKNNFQLQSTSSVKASDYILNHFLDDRIYVLAPVIKSQARFKGKEFINYLLKEGFVRIFVPDTIKPSLKKTKKTKGKTASKKIKKKSIKAKVKTSSKLSNKLYKKEFSLEPSIAEVPGCRDNNLVSNTKDLPGKVIDIDLSTKTSVLPKKDFYVVVDRLQVSKENTSRITDSLALAYKSSLIFNKDISGAFGKVINTKGKTYNFTETNSCPICYFSLPPLTSQFFNFNTSLGACSNCSGFGNVLELDENKIIPNKELSLFGGAILPFFMPSSKRHKKKLIDFCKEKKIPLTKAWKDLSSAQQKQVWNGSGKFKGVVGYFAALEKKKYKMHVRVFLSRFKSAFPCKECLGTRLKKEVSLARIHGFSISDLTKLRISELFEVLSNIDFTTSERAKIKEALEQILSRLDFLIQVGVDYLSLDRLCKTLSGGEFQRLILAKQLGMGLSQTLFVLDEPTIGLHPRDNLKLIELLKKLKNLGNTLVVVEHDKDVILNSDHLIEMGPMAGVHGGEVMFEGSINEFKKSDDLLTKPFLWPNKKLLTILDFRGIDPSICKFKIEMFGCRGNNLKNIDVSIPLNRLVSVTGVSGAGKSSLISSTLYPVLANKYLSKSILPLEHDFIDGLDQIKNVVFIDQSPVGKTTRSNSMTYMKIFSAVRDVFASTRKAKMLGLKSGFFSLNVKGGRCPECEGLGYENVDMMFLDDLKLPCEECDGERYTKHALDIDYRGKNIFDVLNMTVDEAMTFFVAYPKIRKPLSFLKEVGLQYIKIGQSASSLSGGESQRLKVARELYSSKKKSTLYILDEPTSGLHFGEVFLLIKVLNKLIEGGGSVILIEHNLDVIANSDHVIDIGSEGGRLGGYLVAQGSPLEVAKVKSSHTGLFLKKYYKELGLM